MEKGETFVWLEQGKSSADNRRPGIQREGHQSPSWSRAVHSERHCCEACGALQLSSQGRKGRSPHRDGSVTDGQIRVPLQSIVSKRRVFVSPGRTSRRRERAVREAARSRLRVQCSPPPQPRSGRGTARAHTLIFYGRPEARWPVAALFCAADEARPETAPGRPRGASFDRERLFFLAPSAGKITPAAGISGA